MVELQASPDDSGVVAIGSVLADRYRIIGVLGSGGMGRVYRGEHTAIGKPVAIKVLHSALGKNQEAAIRFQREAIASGRLDHPNIVSVMDFGVLADGCLYLIMEALDGEHVGQRLFRDKRIAWPDALAIARGVLLGLRHAHDRGVVHRDIKPDNIFLANKDGEGVVKVLDFGIAKLYAGATDDQAATRAGITVGTPRYLSPEQAVGGAITPACDVYSCSVVLYEMLVGRAPLDSDDPLTLLTSHAGADVPSFHELAPDLEVPEGLEALVRHGLEKIAVERIGSALEYVQRIDEILRANGIDVPATPGSTSNQSMGIPLGPHAASTPGLERTPAPGILTPSPNFLATPMPFAVATPAPAAPPTSAKLSAASEPADAVPLPRRSTRRRWLALSAVAVIALGGAAVAWVAFGHHESEAATSSTVAPTAVVVPQVPAPSPSDEHSVQLKTALATLQEGKSCADRKQAVSQLASLGDPAAIPALKKARARGKANACLRVAVDGAIKTLTPKN